MRRTGDRIRWAACLCAAVFALGLFVSCGGASNVEDDGSIRITNVSYDPTRELYADYNAWFSEAYGKETGKRVKVVQSHGGSGSQARSVVEGSDADVVTLALAHDIMLIQQNGLIDQDWMERFPRQSSPYTSVIVFLVRSGNEKNITGWDDLIRDGVDIITPDPKSSGAACWNFLAAWHYASEKYGGDERKIRRFMKKLYDNASVMDSGARGSTTTFVENGQGDVMVSWENEALQTVSEYPGEYEIVCPASSILAQPSVAVVDDNARRNGTEEVARDYLAYLYTKEAQRIIGEHGYRPSDEDILKEFSGTFDLDMKLCSIDDFGGWEKAYESYFADGGVFDEIMEQ